MRATLDSSTRKPESGFSLIEVLIAAGLVSMVSLTLATVFVQQAQQQRRLTQKYEMLDLQNALLSIFSNPSVCTCQLKDKVFSMSGKKQKAPSFTEIKGGCAPNAQELVDVGEPLLGTQTGLVVSSISLEDFQNVSTDVYLTKLQVTFEPSTMVAAMMPVQVTQRVLVEPGSPANARKVVSCLGAGDPGPPDGGTGGTDPADLPTGSPCSGGNGIVVGGSCCTRSLVCVESATGSAPGSGSRCSQRSYFIIKCDGKFDR